MGMELPLDQTVPDMNRDTKGMLGGADAQIKLGYVKDQRRNRDWTDRQTYMGLETQPLNVFIKFTLFNVLIS